jgi:predicted thioesterase
MGHAMEGLAAANLVHRTALERTRRPVQSAREAALGVGFPVREHAVKPSLAAGLTVAKRITVDESRVISFMGDDCRVYATPRIISDIEYACRNFLLENVEHVGPALLGAEVSIDIKVANVDGRRVTFEATVKDGPDDVLRGTHERFVVAVAKVRERLLKKAAQQAQQQ